MRLDGYQTEGFYDEMFEAPGHPRPGARLLHDMLQSLPEQEISRRQKAAEALLLRLGITFNVYGDAAGSEKIFPFDLIPRIVEAEEWVRIEAGLKQRITALNLFLADIYGDKKILRDGVIPEDVILSAASYRKQCDGLKPPGGVWCHITGSDLVRNV